MDKITLHSRDNINNWLEHYKDRTYILHSELDQIRCGYTDDSMEDIQFVDPPGGPMLYVGSPVKELRGDIIESIRHTDKGFELKML